jgi:hypothetical protein
MVPGSVSLDKPAVQNSHTHRGSAHRKADSIVPPEKLKTKALAKLLVALTLVRYLSVSLNLGNLALLIVTTRARQPAAGTAHLIDPSIKLESTAGQRMENPLTSERRLRDAHGEPIKPSPTPGPISSPESPNKPTYFICWEILKTSFVSPNGTPSHAISRPSRPGSLAPLRANHDALYAASTLLQKAFFPREFPRIGSPYYYSMDTGTQRNSRSPALVTENFGRKQKTCLQRFSAADPSNLS